MTRTVLIAIPCRLITLNVVLGTEESASTLEDLVLQAVAGGRATVRQLAELFSLPSRLMLDVVHGLWSRGFLAVDFTTNALETTPTGAAVRTFAEGRSASAKVEKEKFIFDPVTETIMPHRRGMERVPFGALSMPMTRGVDESDIPQVTLLRAVGEAVGAERRNGMRRKVLEVSFANPLLSPPEAVQWKSVEAVLQRDPATNQITVVPVTMPTGWNQRALERFQSRVRELVRDRPDNRFVEQLLNQEAPVAAPPADLRADLVQLAKLAEDLSSIEPGRLEDRDKRLRGKVKSVLSYLDEAERGRCSVECVRPGAGVDWVLTYLLEQAEHQVVLAVPRISHGALNKVLPQLESVAATGRTLVFLWGDHQSAVLEGKIKTALLDLKSRFPDTVLLETRSGRCMASAIVCDDKYMFVGSRSVLSDDSGAGVLVGPVAGATEGPECVLDVLQWVRKVYPDWENARRIAVRPADFGTGREVPAVAESRRWRRLTVPELATDWREDEIAYRTAWSADWGRVLRELVLSAEDVYRGAPVVRTVCDGSYVDLVSRTIAGAAERLAIIDDGAQAEACGPEVAQAVLDMVDRDLVVHVQHPPFRDNGRPAGKYAEVLERVAARQTLRTSRGKSRAVLRDHELVLGSHGPVGSRAARPTHGRPVAALGLHVISTSFTAEFGAQMGIPDWFGRPDTPGELPGYLPPLVSLSSARVDDDPWTVLDDREAAGAPDDRLCREAAVLLSRTTGRADQRAKWSRRVLYDAWDRRAFMEASLLAPVLGEPTLPAELASVVVALEHGPLGEELYYLAAELADSPPASRLGVLIGVIVELLLYGGESGRYVYEEFTEADSEYLTGVPVTWCRLVEEAAKCFAGTGAPLPLQDIDGWARKQARSADVRHSRQKLRGDVEDFERGEQHFNFVAGQKLHRAMFLPNEAMADVLHIARNDVDDAERARITNRLPGDARSYIDQLAKRLQILPIAWSNHLAYAKKVDRFVAEAGRLVRIPDEVHERPALAPEQRAFARFLEREWRRLKSEAQDVGEPVCHAANALLHRLGSMPIIGKDS